MDDFSVATLRRLIEKQSGLCVSAFLPTHVTGPQALQDAVRLKNLLNRAEQALTDAGMRAPVARDMLAEARRLPEDADFWASRGSGLAVYVGEGAMHRLRVGRELEESLVVNRRFHVKPLLPLLCLQARFLVLALSQNRIRVLEADGQRAREVTLPGMPKNMKQALNITGADAGQQVHSAMRGSLGKQAAVFHGQGGQRESAKSDIAQYFRIVDSLLPAWLHRERPPLILAGVDYLLPIYRQVSDYPNLVNEEIAGNFDYASEHDLRERAEPIARQIARRERDHAAAIYRRLAGTGKATDDIGQIVPAAHDGRVDVLFVDWRASQPGTFDPAERKVVLSSELTPEIDDLLDLAAAATLENGGRVYAVERDEMPSDVPVAAVFRY